jgi:hypothetical protein
MARSVYSTLKSRALGIFRVQGLTVEGKITIVSINDSTWTALPNTSLADRNSITIQNTSGVQMKVQYDNGVGGYVGVAIEPDSERYYNITDGITIYGKSSSGTVDITIEELA